MPGDPKECRAHAALALSSPSALARERFEDLAKPWLRLAVDLERSQALLDEWGNLRPKRPRVVLGKSSRGAYRPTVLQTVPATVERLKARLHYRLAQRLSSFKGFAQRRPALTSSCGSRSR